MKKRIKKIMKACCKNCIYSMVKKGLTKKLYGCKFKELKKNKYAEVSPNDYCDKYETRVK